MIHARYAAPVFDGEGARLYGGRWNSPGRPAVSTAGSLALAALAGLVHMQSRTALTNDVTVRLEFEESLVLTVTVSSLPPYWRQGRASPETRAVGDRWLDVGTTPILAVPSVVIPEEWHYVLNPRHPQCDEIH